MIDAAVFKEVVGGISAGMAGSVSVAWRFADVLVAKGILTKGEAKATLYAIAETVRTDGDEMGSADAFARMATEFERAGDSFTA